jgi:hypothetical protein
MELPHQILQLDEHTRDERKQERDRQETSAVVQPVADRVVPEEVQRVEEAREPLTLGHETRTLWIDPRRGPFRFTCSLVDQPRGTAPVRRWMEPDVGWCRTDRGEPAIQRHLQGAIANHGLR